MFKVAFCLRSVLKYEINSTVSTNCPKRLSLAYFCFRCGCWDKILGSRIGKEWTRVRQAVLSVVDTPAFEWFILVLIFASSVTLCFEDIHLDENPRLKQILYWTNLVFSLIFVIEMVLKWLAMGFHKYFTSFWTLLDFLIVFVSRLCKTGYHTSVIVSLNWSFNLSFGSNISSLVIFKGTILFIYLFYFAVA